MDESFIDDLSLFYNDVADKVIHAMNEEKEMFHVQRININKNL